MGGPGFAAPDRQFPEPPEGFDKDGPLPQQGFPGGGRPPI